MRTPLATSESATSATGVPSVPALPTVPWLSLHVTDVLLVLCVVGVALVSTFPLPQNLAPVDALLVVAIALGVREMLRQPGNPFSHRFVAALPWLWLLILATAVSFAEIGFPGWALDHAMRDIAAPVTFFTLAALMWRRRRVLGNLLIAWVATGTVVAVSTLAVQSDALRQTGTFFDNPNYTAHYLAVTAVITMAAPLPRTVRLVAAALMAVAILPTGSFGGAAVLFGAIAYVLVRAAGSLPGGLNVVARVMVLTAIVGLVVYGANDFQQSDVDLGRGASSERFERSSQRRLEWWGEGLSLVDDHPVGIGPRGFRNRTDLDVEVEQHELHNDYLAFLIENGVLGLVAVLGVMAVVWRTLPRGGWARVLFVGVAVSALFREVMNFRHVWIGLALLTCAYLAANPKAPVRQTGLATQVQQ